MRHYIFLALSVGAIKVNSCSWCCGSSANPAPENPNPEGDQNTIIQKFEAAEALAGLDIQTQTDAQLQQALLVITDLEVELHQPQNIQFMNSQRSRLDNILDTRRKIELEKGKRASGQTQDGNSDAAALDLLEKAEVLADRYKNATQAEQVAMQQELLGSIHQTEAAIRNLSQADNERFFSNISILRWTALSSLGMSIQNQPPAASVSTPAGTDIEEGKKKLEELTKLADELLRKQESERSQAEIQSLTDKAKAFALESIDKDLYLDDEFMKLAKSFQEKLKNLKILEKINEQIFAESSDNKKAIFFILNDKIDYLRREMKRTNTYTSVNELKVLIKKALDAGNGIELFKERYEELSKLLQKLNQIEMTEAAKKLVDDIIGILGS